MADIATNRIRLTELGDGASQQGMFSPQVPAIVGYEPWVTASKAAEFLSIAERRVLAKARAGELPGHPFPGKQRRTWLFLLSELDAYMRGQSAPSTISAAAPTSQRSKSNG